MVDRLSELVERARIHGLVRGMISWGHGDTTILSVRRYPDHVRWYLLFGDWGDNDCVKSRYVLTEAEALEAALLWRDGGLAGR